MPNKMERFTQRARQVLTFAQEEAERFQHGYIGPEHLLIGLMREEGGVANQVLQDLGVEKRRMEGLVEQLTHDPTRKPGNQLDLSAGTKRVLEMAVDEARRMGHHYIGTEHVLLGLVRLPDGVAIEVLKRLGISPEEIRRQIRRVLQSPAPALPGEQAGRISTVIHPIFGSTISDMAFVCDVYMLMPLADELQPIYQDVVRPVVEAQQLDIKRGDDFFSKHEIIQEVWSCIIAAKFVIADCTGQDPNVFYELGIVHTLDKPFILLSQSLEDLPRVVRGKHVLVYDNTPEGREVLTEQLKTAIEHIANEV